MNILVGILLGVLIDGDQNLTKSVYTLLAAPQLCQQLVDDPAVFPNAVLPVYRCTVLLQPDAWKDP